MEYFKTTQTLLKAAKRIREAAFVKEQGFAEEFYEKSGYESVSDLFLDEGCPHIWM